MTVSAHPRGPDPGEVIQLVREASCPLCWTRWEPCPGGHGPGMHLARFWHAAPLGLPHETYRQVEAIAARYTSGQPARGDVLVPDQALRDLL